MRETLRDDGYDADIAPDGAAALEVVRDHTPDVILVDLELPLIDGPSFVERYRRAITTPVNIVVVSGGDDAHEIAQSIGADAYLAKPFERDDLLTAVEWSLTAS
jgi:two-component system, response regulator PdtaR